MTDRDSFLREVDGAVRQDQYKKLWDNYGVYALGDDALTQFQDYTKNLSGTMFINSFENSLTGDPATVVRA